MKKIITLIIFIVSFFYISNVNASSYTHRIKILNNQEKTLEELMEQELVCFTEMIIMF